MQLIKFKIILSPAAQRDIKNLEAGQAIQLIRDIQHYLGVSPLPFGKNRIKRMTGFSFPLYRLRSGDSRAYYRILAHEGVILAMTHNKDSEKIIKKLR